MSQRKRKFFSGSTVEQAVIAAASEYGLAPGEVAYRKVEKKHGFLRMRKRIVIEVDPEAPQRGADDQSVEALPPIPVGRPRDAGFTRIPRSGGSGEPVGGEQDSDERSPQERPRRDRPKARREANAEASPEVSREAGPAASAAPERRPKPDGSARDGRGSGQKQDRPRGRSAAADDREDGGEPRGGRGSRKAEQGRGERDPREALETGSRDGRQRSDDRGKARDRDARGREERGQEAGSRGEKSPGDRGRGDQPRGGEDRGERGRGHGRDDRSRDDRSRGERGRGERGRGDNGGGRRIVDESMDLLDAAEEAVDRLLAVTGLELDFLVEVEDDRVELDLGGPDAEMLLEEDGKALYALELLIPILVRALCGQRVFCQVDSEGYRERREQELRELALEVAEEVAESGEEKTLDYLNPAERRIVHMALADHEEVETESEGRGYLKRLTVWPL